MEINVKMSVDKFHEFIAFKKEKEIYDKELARIRRAPEASEQ